MPQPLLDILVHGYKPDFTGPVSAYSEPNNKSALEHLPFLREKVAAWRKAGFVQKRVSRALCNNPLTVAVKYDPAADEVKLRPVLDCSRHPVKLDDLSTIEQLIQPGDFMCSFDLKNQYFHVKLAPECYEYFGFTLPNEQGEEEFFHFTVMVYGLKSAAQIVTRLILPLKAFIHKCGFRFGIFMDDGFTVASSQEETAQQQAFILTVFQLAGWTVQWTKTSLVPSQRLQYQGFVIDSVEMRFITPPGKLVVLAELLELFTADVARAEPVAPKFAALILGKLSSMIRSHGAIVQVLSRATQHDLGASVFHNGWEQPVVFSLQCAAELNLMRSYLPLFNGQFLTHKEEGGALERRQILNYCDAVKYSDGPLQNLFVSDASDSEAFVYKADGSFEIIQDYVFDENQARASSGLRELLAVKFALSSDRAVFQQYAGQLLFWQTDSKNCANFLIRGSRKEYIQNVVLEIKLLEKDLHLVIVPVWTPREHERILIADLGSKFSLNTDEWSLDRSILSSVFAQARFLPGVDCFATQQNAVVPNFFSRLFDSQAAGINFFAQTLLPSVNYFCCPPISLIIPCVRKLEALPHVSFLLLVPEWPSANFWPILFPHRRPIWPKADIFSTQASFFFANCASSKVFSARPNFSMLAICVKR